MLPKIYYGNNRSTFSVCEVIKATMAWHFSEETGSPFWLSKKRQLGFNPLKDVHSVADLDLFPDFIEEWRHVHVRDLIPRGLQSCERWEFEVYETGGTTGKPHRIVDMASRPRPGLGRCNVDQAWGTRRGRGRLAPRRPDRPTHRGPVDL